MRTTIVLAGFLGLLVTQGCAFEFLRTPRS
jgi:hypothetical protein